MDFSFVRGDAGLQRKQQQPAAGGGQAGGSAAAAASAAQAATPPSRIAIPSFRDVQQAERKRVAVPNMFQPSSVPAGTGNRCERHVVVLFNCPLHSLHFANLADATALVA